MRTDKTSKGTERPAKQQADRQHSDLIGLKDMNRREVSCFGDFVIMHNSDNLISSLTSQEREFAALLFIYSNVNPVYFNGNLVGINPSMMVETMWPEVKKSSLRNRYGVILSKVTEKMKEAEWINVHRNKGMHILSFDPAIHFDFHQFVILRGMSTKNEIIVRELLDILSKGSFFGSESYPWLDDFQVRINLDVIDLLTEMLSLDLSEAIRDECAGILLTWDPLNFDGVLYQIMKYKGRNRFSQAKILYDKYNDLYRENFAEAFPIKFENIKK